MKHAHSPTGALFALLLLHGLSHAGTAQDPSTFEEHRDPSAWMPSDGAESRPTIFEGRVLTPEGSPAQGAVVVSSAGERAVTDEEGSFRLAVELESDVTDVRVTAAQSGGAFGLVASASVSELRPGGTILVGTLNLGLGDGCEPSWLPTFGGFPGVSNDVSALAVFDDGSGDGPALYAGGWFTIAGGVEASFIARWDGASWSALGSGTNSNVFCLAVFDDGSGGGPALYAGGWFTTAGGVAANRIAKWDGTTWSPLGSGMNDTVAELAVFDDGSGSGPALYAGGSFTTAGGSAASRIAKWDGNLWSPVGGGVNDAVGALTVFNDGGGSALYVGGSFTTAAGLVANHVAKWDGTAWSPLGSGTNHNVFTLAPFDDGSGGGPALFAGGFFTMAGGVTANRIARWDGSAWAPVGGGMDSSVRTLTIFDDGTGGGSALYVGGSFTLAGGVAADAIAKWDGSTWSALGNGIDSYSPSVGALAVHDDGSGSGPALYVGGDFLSVEGETAYRIARWDGASWSPIGTRGLDDTVSALQVFDDGSGGGPALYVGGEFDNAGDLTVNHVAKWDGSSLSPLGIGIQGSSIVTLTTFDDGSGSGPALYAAGRFTAAGGTAANNVAKWDGTSWSSLGSGIGPMNSVVYALAVYDDGSGPELYAGGSFTTADGVPASYIAKWDGTSWSSVGGGMNDWVCSLAVYEVAGREALYAGGKFTTAGGVPAYCVAKWNGTSWADVGVGMGDAVWSFAVHDDGSGGGLELYAGGWFLYAGGMYTPHIAKWNGTTWAPVGSGMNDDVLALAVYDDGTGRGPALYAGGDFTTAGGASARRIAKWDGASWSSVGSGMSFNVLALASFDDGLGGGPALYAGGSFTASPGGDSYLAKWGCPRDVGVAYCFCDGSGTPAPCGNAGSSEEGCANSTGMGAVLAAEGSTSMGADDISFHATNLLPNQPATLFAGHNAVNNGDGISFGDGLRCAGGNVERLGVEVPNASGAADWGPGLASTGGWNAGDTRRFQVWYRNPTGSPCMTNFNLSNGWEVAFTR